MSSDGVRLFDTSWSRTCLGRVEPDGRIFDASWSGRCVGRVEPDGRVFDASWSGTCVGRVEPDGRVFDASWSGTCVGRVEPDGRVLDAFWSGTCIGHVEGTEGPEFIRRAGAALLLLLRPPGVVEPQPPTSLLAEAATMAAAEGVRGLRRRRAKGDQPTTEHGVRLLGVAQSSGYQVFWALPDDVWFGMYCLQNGGIPAKTPGDVDDTIRLQRSLNDQRHFVAVVEGDRDFLASFVEGCTAPDMIILCSDVETLRTFSTTPVDARWKQGDQQLNIADWL